MDVDDHFTRMFEDAYSLGLVEAVRYLFDDNAALTEAFFALHGQFDMLIEAHDVSLHDGEKQVQDDWKPDLVLEAVDEAVTLARSQNSPAWPALMAIASAMRVMVRTASIIPSTEFKQDEAEGIPPGLFKLLQSEEVRPFDFAVAAVSGDMSMESMIHAAVVAERGRCESVVKDRIKDLFGREEPNVDDLNQTDAWMHEQLERVRSEVACAAPLDHDAP